jgi:hypothetical protein
MLDPLSELVASLNRTGSVPARWRERHAPDGDLAAVWRSCEVPRVMAKVLYMAARDDDATRAVEATQRALDDARRESVPMDRARIRACDAIREVVPTPPTLDELARSW